MAGLRIQLRTTTAFALVDGSTLGEAIINITDWAFGVEIGTSIPVWLPAIDKVANNMVLHQGQNLTGKDVNANSNVYFDWDSAGGLILRNSNTNTTMATFGTAAQSVTQISDDLLNNGAAQSIENFDLINAESEADNVITLTTTSQNVPLEGNHYLWVEKPTPTFTADFVKTRHIPVNVATTIRNSGLPVHGSHLFNRYKGPGLFKNTDERYPQGVGLRSWVHLPNASDLPLTFFAVAYMSPTGGSFQTRVGYPGNFKVFDTSMALTPFTALVFHYDPSYTAVANKGKPLAIDWFYNVWWDDTSDGLTVDRELILASMAVFPGKIEVDKITPAMLQEAQNRMHTSAYATGTKRVTSHGNKIQHVNFARPLLSDEVVINITNSPYTITISDKNKWGFSYKANTAPTTGTWTFDYSAHVIGDVSDL